MSSKGLLIFFDRYVPTIINPVNNLYYHIDWQERRLKKIDHNNLRYLLQTKGSGRNRKNLKKNKLICKDFK